MKETFNSKIGAIAAAAGSAVGLGNVWRFPYILGEDGGGAFLLLYIICMLFIGVPVMISEFVVGRMSGKPVATAYSSLVGDKRWQLIGVGGTLVAFLILAFYTIVSGWTLYYCYLSLTGQLSGLDEPQIKEVFTQTAADPVTCIIWMIIVTTITAAIVARGVTAGIERVSKILMPILIILIVLIAIRAMTLDGGMEGIVFMLTPDFEKINSKAFFDALGQAFFSASIGMGCMTTYGSYISKQSNIAGTAIWVSMIDFFIAFMSALMIFPCVFAFGISPSEGPGLVFVSLPNVFNQMPMGQLFQTMFFFLLFIAALTSVISLLEVVVTFVMERFGLKRRAATVASAIAITIPGIICAFSSATFDFFDKITASVMMPLGAIFIVIYVVHLLGRDRVRGEFEAHGKKSKIFNVYFFLVKYIVPVAIALIFINGVIDWIM